MLSDGRFTPEPAEELLRAFAGRVAVVAVGSNASPEVLHRKLRREGERGEVPILPGSLVGCAVGHSAHVSLRGYVAAAPHRDADARTPVFLSLLDVRQLAMLDATEPNYDRLRFASGDAVRLELDTDLRPEAFHLYQSRWGVIAPPDGDPVPFGEQWSLHELLRAEWPPYAEILEPPLDPAAGVEERTRLLAEDESLRTAVREALHDTGWTRPSGLAD